MGSRSYDAEFADIVSYSADDQAVGQYYIALAAQYPDDADVALEPVKARLDHIIENPSDVDLDHSIDSVLPRFPPICSLCRDLCIVFTIAACCSFTVLHTHQLCCTAARHC